MVRGLSLEVFDRRRARTTSSGAANVFEDLGHPRPAEALAKIRLLEKIQLPQRSKTTSRTCIDGLATEATSRVDALRKAGTIAWSGRRLRPAKPVGKVRGRKTVADLIVENRE